MASRDRSSEHHYCLRVVEFEVVATVKKMTVLGALVLVLAGAGTASATGQFLYRCLTLDHTDHFVSPSAECEGTTTEQVLGCTAPSDAPAGATVPLLRCFNGTDHLVSTDANCPTGYHQEQALGSWHAKLKTACRLGVKAERHG